MEFFTDTYWESALYTQMQVDSGGLDYNILLVQWNQIGMHLSTLRIYLIVLSSHVCFTIHHRFKTWCLIVEHKYHDTLLLPLCSLLLDTTVAYHIGT